MPPTWHRTITPGGVAHWVHYLVLQKSRDSWDIFDYTMMICRTDLQNSMYNSRRRVFCPDWGSNSNNILCVDPYRRAIRPCQTHKVRAGGYPLH